MRCCAWRSPTSASTRSASPAARSASSPTPTHGKAKILEVKGDRVREALAEGKVVRRRRLPGRQHRQGDHHAGPRRQRPHRVGAGPGAEAPTPARSTPTSPACSPPIRASCPRPASCRTSTSTRCSRWPAPAARCSPCAASSSPATTTSRSTSAPPSPGSRARGSPIEEPSMEDPIISGVVTDTTEAKVTVLGVPDRPGISAALFEPLAAANVNVDMIVQNTSHRRHHRHQLHDAEGRHGRRPSRSSSRVAAEVGATGVSPRRRHRQDQPSSAPA